MAGLTSDAPPPHGRGIWRGAAGVLILLGLVAGALLVLKLVSRTRAKEASALPEMARKDLLLRDGRWLRSDTTAPFTGLMLEHYPGGQLKSRAAVSNGLLEGLSAGWYSNGVQQIEEHFRTGVSHGARVKWYEDGSRLSTVTVSNGQLEGTFQRWHTNGVLAEQVELHQGQPDGWSRAFYPSGSLKAEARMQQGRVIERKFWNDGERPATNGVTGLPAQ